MDKIANIKNAIVKNEDDPKVLLVTALDEIAWILNLRGSDIKCNPVFFSYLIIDFEKEFVTLCIDKEKVAALESNEAFEAPKGFSIVEYCRIDNILEDFRQNKCKVAVDTSKCNSKLISILEDCFVSKNDVVAGLKAAKNKTEQEGMRACNIRDCAAIMKYFAFLEEELRKEDHGLDEFTGAETVGNYRKQGDLFQGLSFDAISSIGPNGAIIHYSPQKETAHKLNNDEIYLLDSGGQYLDGTTDITRTVHLGGKAPTAFQKEAYTRVLLGTLSLERIVWPSTANYGGSAFDALARMHLWQAGLDYGHGTGHGVGSYLNVHEGPQGINSRSTTKLVEGMCVSDEPGYYKDGEFGIRIENVIMVQKHPNPEMAEKFYYFENLTYAPYNRDLIDTNLLSPDVRNFIDSFHKSCFEKLAPYLQDDKRALDYVTRQCAPL